MAFLVDKIRVTTGDGRNFVLVEPLEYWSADGHRYRVPAGTSTDGMSTPAALWTLIPPFGPQWMPAVCHDSGYRGTLESWTGTGWAVAGLDRAQCDSLLAEALACQHVPQAEIDAIFAALRAFGEKAWEDDLSMPLPSGKEIHG